MSGFTYDFPYKDPTVTSTVTQGPGLAGPRLDANAPPFAQPNRQHYQGHTHIHSHEMSRYQPVEYAPTTHLPLPGQYDQGQLNRPGHHTLYSNVYSHPPARSPAEPPLPRRGAFCPDALPNARPNMAWFDAVGGMSTLPSQPMMGETPGSPPPFRRVPWEDSVVSNHVFPRFQQQSYPPTTQQPPAGWTGGYGQGAIPARASPDRSRQAHPIARRSSQQGSRQYNSNIRHDFTGRASRLYSAQGRLSDGSDVSRALTSPDAEEAAARVPQSYRNRRLPREPRMRYSNPAQFHDPNLATSRQVEELKDKLSRRLPCELPEGTSKTCDICAKDYSSTQVQPCEENEVAIELPCGHCFGEFCIFEWVRIASPSHHLRMRN